MKNYICINGNKTELTKEQLKQLGIELPKTNPFERVEKGEKYYCIEALGNVCAYTEDYYGIDTQAYDVANYCTDNAILEQRALHETLNRLLWRYSMEHDGDKINLNNSTVFKYGVKHTLQRNWTTFSTNAKLFGVPLFATEMIALDAIEEIIKPFIAEHPNFKF